MSYHKIIDQTNAILRSRRLFWVVFGIFIFEAVWIALSAVYPQAFDENFHFGVIQVYSHYWLPFLSKQPPNADAYGAVARDPSYLYHYLMSFPYRLIRLVIHDQTGQIIALRFINIALFSSGLILFRRVLLRAHISAALTNITLAIFVLIPVASQLAAHINYDNLLFPLVAWVCLLSFKAIDELRMKRPNARTLIALLVVCLFTSIVKYAFLPIFLGVVLYLTYFSVRNFRGKYKLLWQRIWQSWLKQPLKTKLVLSILLLVSIGMFTQRDMVNLIEYHTFIPNCNQVLSVQQCEKYSPWNYDYLTHLQVLASKPGTLHYYNPIAYIFVWVYWMWYRLFFAINGPNSGFTNYPPLPLPSAAAGILGIVGVIVVIKMRRKIFRNNPYLILIFVISASYIVTLWLDGYIEYHYTHVLQAMNGRYLLPVLLLLGAIMGRAFSIGLRDAPTRKTALATIILVLFLQGGGVLTFISRSDPSWYWNNNSVVKVNTAAQKITRRVIIKGRKTYSTTVWFYN
jgi:hypothetical protein